MPDKVKSRTVTKSNGVRTVSKTKKYNTPEGSVTKSTVKSGGKTTRSVETKKPGYTSTTTNMGPVSQGKLYRRQIKKIK